MLTLSVDANLFKDCFLKAQKENEAILYKPSGEKASGSASDPASASVPAAESTTVDSSSASAPAVEEA